MGVPQLLLASTAVSAYGSYQQGKAQARQYQAQAQIAQRQSEAEARNYERQVQADLFNAKLAELDAQSVMAATGANEDTQRRQARQILAAQRGAMIQSGTADTFSGQMLLDQSLMEAERDALNIRYQGIFEARNIEQEAQNLRMSAEQAEINAQTARALGTAGAANLQASATSARRAGAMGAATQLLGGYYQYKKGR